MAVYLDYNASAPIDLKVLDEMVSAYKEVYGNSDSRTHNFGENARARLEDARGKVASLLGVKKEEIFFTSGSTEANNIAIRGLRNYGIAHNKKHIVMSAIEHKAVLNAAKSLEEFGFEVQMIVPGMSGRVDVEEFKNAIRPDTLLVSLMHVNNETGIIQPVKELADYLVDKDVFFHVDATQSCGKLVEEIRELKYDMLSLSAHKFCGPQGIGALVLKRKKYKLPPVKPIMYGGQQEHGIRPGTIPVALCVGLGKACEIAEREYQDHDRKNKEIKDCVISALDESGLKYGFNGDQDYCVNSTVNVHIDGVSSEALMLSSKQFCGVSNGSACNSKSYDPSYVLTVMGIPEDVIENSIRISWGANIDPAEVKEDFNQLLKIAANIKG